MKMQSPPIFIIGSYRSGTSILTWALGQHANILPLEETNWIYKYGVHIYNLFKTGIFDAEHSHLGSTGCSEEYFYEFFGNSLSGFVKSAIPSYMKHSISMAINKLPDQSKKDLLNLHLSDHNLYHYLAPSNFSIKRSESDPKERWVDGTPENSHFVYGLQLMFPNAKFIHILRNPKKVVRSLMNFSTMGQFDYEEENAYKTWRRLVSDCVLAERALGSEKVLRIYQEDLEQFPRETITKCLEFVDEQFIEDCLLPLKEKINSSTYSNDFDFSIETNIQSNIQYEKECFEFYQDILDQYNEKQAPVEEALVQMKNNYVNYCQDHTMEKNDELHETINALNNQLQEKEQYIIQLKTKYQQSVEPLVVNSIGPEFIQAGISFNLQPDGSNAIWVKGENFTQHCVIYIDDICLSSTFENDKLITATVPGNLTVQPKNYNLYIKDTYTNIVSNAVDFKVNEQFPGFHS